VQGKYTIKLREWEMNSEVLTARIIIGGRPDETSAKTPPVIPPHKKIQTEVWTYYPQPLKQKLD
jgi:hypothetical protein